MSRVQFHFVPHETRRLTGSAALEREIYEHACGRSYELNRFRNFFGLLPAWAAVGHPAIVRLNIDRLDEAAARQLGWIFRRNPRGTWRALLLFSAIFISPLLLLPLDPFLGFAMMPVAIGVKRHLEVCYALVPLQSRHVVFYSFREIDAARKDEAKKFVESARPSE